jgi:hypothetical protein
VTFLEPVASPSRERLAALELEAAARERELIDLKTELQALQTTYLSETGALYAELTGLEAAVAEVEIRMGLRVPLEELEDDASDAGPELAAGCGNRAAPSIDLKRIFRDVAKAIHPDLARDEAARYRRHSLMAEANRAYAERDEDRLRLILGAWARGPESALGDLSEADVERIARRTADLEARLAMLDLELADVRASAIAGLRRKVEEARAQGWDLFAEMAQHVKREIARARARLEKLSRQAAR